MSRIGYAQLFRVQYTLNLNQCPVIALFALKYPAYYQASCRLSLLRTPKIFTKIERPTYIQWIFIGLLLLNGILPLWYLFGPSGQGDMSAMQSVVIENHRPVPESAAPIVLIAELPAEALQVLDELDPPRERAALCTMVGPFDDLESADRFVARLNILDVQASSETVQLSAGAGYQVYLPPQNSSRDARKLLAQLHSAGVDSYIIARGELARGIHLGVFSDRAQAQSHIAELQALGWSAESRLIDRSYREIWVMFGPGEAQKIDRKTWWEWLDQKKPFEEQQNFCLDVASGSNFL